MPRKTAPWRARRRKIQLPYINKFHTLWEYRKSFLKGRIEFSSFIGSVCPICGALHCYRQITPYWRYAIELYPEFKKERIPIGRFLCRNRRETFSLLPIQLIPYFQYTVSCVIGTLLSGARYWQTGYRGFFGASMDVDPNSGITPWLIFSWLMMVVRALKRAHAVLTEFYDLNDMRTPKRSDPWQDMMGYFRTFGWHPDIDRAPPVLTVLRRYARATKDFLFGIASQHRVSAQY